MAHLTVPHPLSLASLNRQDRSLPTIPDILIRFSDGSPDLFFSSRDYIHRNAAALKQAIRARLSEDKRWNKLRLIYGGKVLDDYAPLHEIWTRTPGLRTWSPEVSYAPVETYKDSLRSNIEEAEGKGAEKGKGKGRADNDIPESNTLRLSHHHIVVHCAISDIQFSPTEQDAETQAASLIFSSSAQSNLAPTRRQALTTITARTTQPRGFDRLLTSSSSNSFTPAEIHSLRTQFQSILSSRYPADEMPDLDTQQRLEDEWLDSVGISVSDSNSNSSNSPANHGSEPFSEVDDAARRQNDMLYGLTLGFLWPVGMVFALSGLSDGVLNERRKAAVLLGIVLNLGLGALRY